MSNLVRETELFLAQVDDKSICQRCLHPVVSHLHSLLSCCTVSQPMQVMDLHGVRVVREVCRCESVL